MLIYMSLILVIASFGIFGWGLQLAASTWSTSRWGEKMHCVKALSNLGLLLVFSVGAAALADLGAIPSEQRQNGFLYSLPSIAIGYVVRSMTRKKPGTYF